jgi:hypothetical protein
MTRSSGRRLRQKLEFMAEDTIDAIPPTDADLQAWLDAHPDTFALEPEIAFRQVYLNPERRGTFVEEDARRLRERLSSSGSDRTAETLGDSVMLPHDLPRSTRTDVARQFGDEFAARILAVATRQWVGPLRSSYGVHVVYVREREDARLPALADVRPLVEREFIADRRKRQLDAMYATFLQRYQVVVERPSDDRRGADVTAAHGGGPR